MHWEISTLLLSYTIKAALSIDYCMVITLELHFELFPKI